MGFGGVDPGDGESDMHEDVVADNGFRGEGKVDALTYAAEIDVGGAECGVIPCQIDHSSWYCKAHVERSLQVEGHKERGLKAGEIRGNRGRMAVCCAKERRRRNAKRTNAAQNKRR